MTTSEHPPTEAYAWVWLPLATEPVVAGLLEQRGSRITFTYGRSYRSRPDAIPLYLPELPLVPGRIEPVEGLSLASCLRDAAPDSWGQRVILARHTGYLTRNSDTASLSLLTYLLESGSDRIGGLDFQTSPNDYTHRGDGASLADLNRAAELLEAGEPLPDELARALIRGTSIGGARPKALLDAGDRQLVAKFSSTTDTYPVVRAEALGMNLAEAAGVRVPRVEVTRSLGRDVLLVERFDRDGVPGRRHRRLMVSALTMQGLDEMMGRYATYVELAEIIRARFTEPSATLAELFRRIAVNICIGNTDDHARNHSAFWDGHELSLTPAYDLCPQPRSGRETNQAMAFGEQGQRASRLRLLRESAPVYHLSDGEADGMIKEVVAAIHESFAEAADRAQLTKAEADAFRGRQILNPFIFE